MQAHRREEQGYLFIVGKATEAVSAKQWEVGFWEYGHIRFSVIASRKNI